MAKPLFTRTELNSAKKRLHPRQLEAAKLHVVGQTYSEIANTLSISNTSAAELVKRAARNIKTIRLNAIPLPALEQLALKHGGNRRELEQAVAHSAVRQSVGNTLVSVVESILSGKTYGQTAGDKRLKASLAVLPTAVFRLTRLTGTEGKGSGPVVEHDSIKQKSGADLLRLVLFHPNQKDELEWRRSTRAYNRLMDAGLDDGLSWEKILEYANTVRQKQPMNLPGIGPALWKHLAKQISHVAENEGESK